jgi:hypothetical protein
MADKAPAVLHEGDELSAGITVRGQDKTDAQALALAKHRLDQWQGQQLSILPLGCHFQSSDIVTPRRSGEFSVTRTVKVVADENPQ